MHELSIIETGIIDNENSAYPTVIRINGEVLLAAYTIRGGALATGGTVCSKSEDNGKTWERCSTICPPGENPPTRNSLRLSRSTDGQLLAYGMVADRLEGKMHFGQQQRRDPYLCRSSDCGLTWSKAEKLDVRLDGPFEISNPIVILNNGTWIAPAATMPSAERLGEKVVAFISYDCGKTWPDVTVVMQDPENVKGFFEQKIIELEPNRLLATAWTVKLDGYSDLENHFAISNDGGRTWSLPKPTGIKGQTLTPIWLKGDKLLVLYNCRYGRQGVKAAVVKISAHGWTVECEKMVWDAQIERNPETAQHSGIEEIKTIAFGLPSALQLDEKTFLVVHWCEEHGKCNIRWTRIQTGNKSEFNAV